MGVDVRLGKAVTHIDAHGVELGEERIASATVVWAAGVRATDLARSLGATLDRGGRVLVEPDLSLPGEPRVFVIGDAAAVPWRGGTVPGMCPGAIQMGRHVAAGIERAVRGLPSRPFVYRDKGLLATIGRSRAVAVLGSMRFAGFPAWVVWVFVHIAYLIGFRNRVLVLFEWAWLYCTRQRGARVVLGGGSRRRDAAEPQAPGSGVRQ